MKMLSSLFVGTLSLLTADMVAAPRAQITVVVRDEAGSLLTDAEVHAGFDNRIEPGHGWGMGKPNSVKGVTDAKGECILSGDTDAGSVGFSVMKVGYYGSAGQSIGFRNAVLGHWQPWNQTMEVVLKKKVNPIPMYARKVEVSKGMNARVALKADEAIAYDLEKGDWVAPYGKGQTADFVFRIEAKPTTSAKNEFRRDVELFDATLTLTFSNPDDGIQAAPGDTAKGSSLRLPRIVPDDGYEANHTSRRYRTKPDEPIHSDAKEDQNYFFRVRTKKNGQGNIVSALYGKIHGELGWGHGGWVKFTYYLNPTPNDRNVEFDPKKNLFKKLTSLEEVSDP